MVPTPEPTARSRLAVLIPVHNDQPRLARTLNALAADGGSFDVVVVDDGSAPPLRAPEGLPFALTLLRLDANRGITGALNAGLAHIVQAGHYDYVARLDAGDISRPGRMAAQMAFLDAHSDHALVGGAVTFVDLDRHPLFVFRPPTDDQRLRRFQRYRIGFMHPAMMLRLSALEEAGFYDERFTGAEDYELVLRLARRWKLANLAQVCLDYEINPHALSARRFRQGIARLRVQAHHFEARDPHAWLGFARNLLLLLVTRGLVLRVKRWLTRLPGAADGRLERREDPEIG